MADAIGNFIGGEWRPARSGAVFANRNPADTRELIGRLADSGPEDVTDAGACPDRQRLRLAIIRSR